MEHCSPYPCFGFRVTFVKRGQCAPRKHFEAANHLNFTCNRQDLRFKIILRLLFREGQISKRRCTILVPVQSNLVSLEEDELTSYKKKKKNSQFEILNSKRKKTKEHDYSSMKLKEKYRGEIRRIEAKSKEYSWTSRKHRWKKERVRGLLSSLERFPWCSSNVANHRSLARIGLRVRDLFRHGMTLLADRSFEQSCLSSLARLKPPSTPSFSRLEQQNCVCPRVDRELNPGD